MIEDYYTDRVTICNPIADEWDNVSWSYEIENCRLIKKEKTLRVNGEEKRASYKVALRYNANVRSNSRIYIGAVAVLSGSGAELPTENLYLILEVYRVQDFEGSHLEVTI